MIKAITDTGITSHINHFIYKNYQAPLFRVRPGFADDFPINAKSNFGYAPNPKIGRCNVDGEAVLYTALESKTAVLETMREEPISGNLWLSLWLPKREIKCLVFLFDSASIEDSFTRELNDSIIEQLMQQNENFEEYLPLYQWVSEQFLGDNHNFAGLLSSTLFEIHKIDGILYPSYAGKRNGINLVLSKHFVDTNLELSKVLHLKIHEWEFPERVQYLFLGKGEINKSGNITWNQEVYFETGIYITEKRMREKIVNDSKFFFIHEFGK